MEVLAEIRPDLLSKGARKEEMSEGLLSRACMAKKRVRSEREDASTQGKGVQEQFVQGFLMARSNRRAPNTRPDVRRRDSQTRNGTSRPVQSQVYLVRFVKKTTSLGGGELACRDICSQKIVENGRRTGRGGKGRGREQRRWTS
jgi:hypothetical protein